MASIEQPPSDPADNSATDSKAPAEIANQLYTVAFERSRTPMVIASNGERDNPIVLANQAFLDLTGYALDEVVGKDCRFLQGSRTSKSMVAAIGSALRAGQNVDVAVANYRKDGSEFLNQLHISPITDADDKVLYYFASQLDVTKSDRMAALEASERRLLREVDHRAKNVMAVVNSIVRLSRSDDPELYAASVRKRVQALADVHTLLAETGWHPISLGQLIEPHFKSFATSAVRLDGPHIPIDAADAQPIGLVFHELTANAATHGALASPAGTLDIRWHQPSSGGSEIEWTEKGGAVPATTRKPGFGTVMVDALVIRQMGGTIDRDWRNSGLALKISLPPKARSAATVF